MLLNAARNFWSRTSFQQLLGAEQKVLALAGDTTSQSALGVDLHTTLIPIANNTFINTLVAGPLNTTNATAASAATATTPPPLCPPKAGKKITVATPHYVHPSAGASKSSSSSSAAGQPPIVLVHGYGGGLGLFCKNVVPLARRQSVYAIDMIGFGRSSRPKTNFAAMKPESVENYFVDSLEAWRKAMNIPKMILLGHSLGGYVTTAYALRYPERIDRLILASPFGVPLPPSPAATAAQAKQQSRMQSAFEAAWNAYYTPMSLVRAMGPVGASVVRRFVHLRFKGLDEPSKEALSEYVHHLWVGAGSGEFVINSLFVPFGYAKRPLLPRLSQLSVPTYFLYGAHDWMDPRPVLALQSNSQTHNPFIRSVGIVPDSGHQLYLENPDGFNAAVIKILDDR